MASKGEASSRGTNLCLPFDVNVMLNLSHNTTHNLGVEESDVKMQDCGFV